MSVRDTYCSFCGAAYEPPLTYPRTCPRCATQVWANPTPVGVMLAPVRHDGRVGLLVVRRAIPPQIGKLALVGGFVEEHESWQAGAAREVREEANVIVDPATVEPFWFASSSPRPNRVLLFGLAAEVGTSALGAFAPNHETSERGLVFGAGGLDEVFAFPLHVEAARRFFDARGQAGPHDFRPL